MNGTTIGTLAYEAAPSGFGQRLVCSGAGRGNAFGLTNLATGQPFYIQIKVSTSATTSGTPQVFLACTSAFWIGFQANKITMAVNGRTVSFSTSTTFNDGADHWVAFQRYSDNTIGLYVDGVKINTFSNGGANFDLVNLTVGGDANGTGLFTGKLDELTVIYGLVLTTPTYTVPTAPGSDSVANQKLHIRFDGNLNDSNINYSGIVPGTVTIVGRGLTTISAQIGAETGGSGTGYTRVWKYSTDGTTFVNYPGPVTGLSFSGTGLTSGQKYYLRVDGSDSIGNTYSSTVISVTTKVTGERTILFVGDSETQGFGLSSGDSLVDCFKNSLALFGATSRVVTVYNAAVYGSQTSDWLMTAPSGNLPSAISAANAIGAEDAVVMLGTNDSAFSVTKVSYKANQQSIATSLFANIPTLQRVHFNRPPYPNDGRGSTKLQLLSDYNDAIGEIVNGTTLYRGDARLYDEVLNNVNAIAAGTISSAEADLQNDQLHLSKKGAKAAGDLQVYAYAVNTGLISTGGTGSRISSNSMTGGI